MPNNVDDKDGIFKLKLVRLPYLQKQCSHIVSKYGSNLSNNIELGAILIDSCFYNRSFKESYDIIANEFNKLSNTIVEHLNNKYKSRQNENINENSNTNKNERINVNWNDIVANYKINQFDSENRAKFVQLLDDINDIFFNVCKFEVTDHHSSSSDPNSSLLSHVLGKLFTCMLFFFVCKKFLEISDKINLLFETCCTNIDNKTGIPTILSVIYVSVMTNIMSISDKDIYIVNLPKCAIIRWFNGCFIDISNKGNIYYKVSQLSKHGRMKHNAINLSSIQVRTQTNFERHDLKPVLLESDDKGNEIFQQVDFDTLQQLMKSSGGTSKESKESNTSDKFNVDKLDISSIELITSSNVSKNRFDMLENIRVWMALLRMHIYHSKVHNHSQDQQYLVQFWCMLLTYVDSNVDDKDRFLVPIDDSL